MQSTIVATEPFLILDVEVGAPVEIGGAGAGGRRCIPITGGRVSGTLRGAILPGGADWQMVHPDGSLQIDAHYAFRTDDGAVVEVRSNGVRTGPADVLKRMLAGDSVDPRQYYFRTSIRMHTGAEALSHLNFRLAVARGERQRHSVHLEVFEVL